MGQAFLIPNNNLSLISVNELRTTDPESFASKALAAFDEIRKKLTAIEQKLEEGVEVKGSVTVEPGIIPLDVVVIV